MDLDKSKESHKRTKQLKNNSRITTFVFLFLSTRKCPLINSKNKVTHKEKKSLPNYSDRQDGENKTL